MKKLTYLFLFTLLACSGTDDSPAPITQQRMYFPDSNTEAWETATPASAGWNESAITPLLDYLEQKNTKAFIVLVNGKIVLEEYMNGHTPATPWYWASAGKTLTAATVGIAEQEGHLAIDSKVSDYLGTGWTSASTAKENLITNRHLLTMTSGLNDALGDDVSPGNLQYVADAGTRWAYHNVYVKLQDVVAQSTGQSWSSYFNTKLRDRIGMTGTWFASGEDLSVYASNARSMARFGLLALTKGKWKNEQIVNEAYFSQSVSTSQNINKSYGYLWWLNGKDSYHLPQTQMQFNGSLIAAAPADMYAALGKNDQKIYVVPSRNMVIIRMGDAADGSNFALSGFDATLWEKIMEVIE